MTQCEGKGGWLSLRSLLMCRRADLGMLVAVLAAVSRGPASQRAAAAHAALQAPALPGTVSSADAANYISLLKVSLMRYFLAARSLCFLLRLKEDTTAQAIFGRQQEGTPSDAHSPSMAAENLTAEQFEGYVLGEEAFPGFATL